MDGKTLAGDSHDTSEPSLAVMKIYLRSGSGTEGRTFAMPAKFGNDIYQVWRKLENGNSIIVRARQVAAELTPEELEEMLGRR